MPPAVAAQETGPAGLRGSSPTLGSGGVFTLDSSDVADSDDFSGAFLITHSDNPLNFEDRATANVASRTTGDLVLSLGVMDRLEVGVGVPVVLEQSGINDRGDDLGGTSLGDVQVRPKVVLLDGDGDGVGLATYGKVGLPTGERDDLTTTGEFFVEPGLIADVRSGRWLITANAGARVERETNFANFETGTRLLYGVGTEYDVLQDELKLGAEVFGGTDATYPWGKRLTSPIESLAGVKYIEQNTGVQVQVAAGGGVVEGYSTPEWKVMTGVGFALGNADTDNDGLIGRKDTCPDRPEDKDGFRDLDGCPDRDNDEDGLADLVDACPNTPEDHDGWASLDGCPDRDNDYDGVADAADRCPNDSGRDGFGCPITEDPLKVVVNNELDVPAPVVEVTDDVSTMVSSNRELVLPGRVYFETGSHTLEERARPLLRNLASILRNRADIERVGIIGHADVRGDEAYNRALSERRAAAVKRFLVARGISPSRLVTIPMGEFSPALAPVDAPLDEKLERYEADRRVQFRILEDGSPAASR